MNLLIDIGNSRIKWARADYLEHEDANSFPLSDIVSLQDAWTGLEEPANIFISNVASLDYMDEIRGILNSLWQCKISQADVQDRFLGLEIIYNDIKQLGVDRWLGMLYVWHTVNKPACVISCGTALTIDGINGQGLHIGGYILPGHELMHHCLMENTANINVDNTRPDSLGPGQNTTECVNNGIKLALVSTINRAVEEIKSITGSNPELVLTGGGSQGMAEILTNNFIIERDLVLKGLSIYSEYA